MDSGEKSNKNNVLDISNSRSEIKLSIFETQSIKKTLCGLRLAMSSRFFESFATSYLPCLTTDVLTITKFCPLKSASAWKHIKVVEERQGY